MNNSTYGELPKLTDKKVKEMDDWFAANVTVDGSWVTFTKVERQTHYTPRRVGARTNYYTVKEDIKVPYKAPTLAAYLQIKRPDLKVDCSPWSDRYGRQGSNGVYYSWSDRTGYRLRVYDPNDFVERQTFGGNTYKEKRCLYDHDTTETYRTNNDIAEFIAKALAGVELKRGYHA